MVSKFLSNNMPFLDVYALLLESTIISVKLVQEPKTLSPILVTLSGIVTLVKPVQYSNAPYPILVTLSGMVTLVKLVHS